MNESWRNRKTDVETQREKKEARSALRWKIMTQKD